MERRLHMTFIFNSDYITLSTMSIWMQNSLVMIETIMIDKYVNFSINYNLMNQLFEWIDFYCLNESIYCSNESAFWIEKLNETGNCSTASSVLFGCINCAIREVQQFVGFTNYYRRFIHNYSSIATPPPLTNLTKKNVKGMWNFISSAQTRHNVWPCPFDNT